MLEAHNERRDHGGTSPPVVGGHASLRGPLRLCPGEFARRETEAQSGHPGGRKRPTANEEGKGTYHGRDRSARAGRIGRPCTAGEEGGCRGARWKRRSSSTGWGGRGASGRFQNRGGRGCQRHCFLRGGHAEDRG